MHKSFLNNNKNINFFDKHDYFINFLYNKS